MAQPKMKQRSDGRYQMQVYLGEVDGKRKYKTVYGKTQKEVKEKANEVKSQKSKGIDILAQKTTFGEIAEKWLEIKRIEISKHNYETYYGYLKHFKPVWDIEISKICTADLQSIITSLSEYNPNTKKPTSKSSLTRFKLISGMVFEFAIENRIIEFNPAKYVKIPKYAPKEERRSLTKEEQQWIIKTPHRCQIAAMIMLFAGLRKGELLALTWSDIDLINGTIDVNKSVEFYGGKYNVKSGAKTESGVRIIEIPDILINFLKEQEKMKKSLIVFPNRSGQTLSESSWKRCWEDYLKTLNSLYGNLPVAMNGKKKDIFVIDRFTAHNLRHTYASILYEAGVDVLTAKEFLGHADVQTTLNIYTHLDKGQKKKETLKLNSFLNASQMLVSST